MSGRALILSMLVFAASPGLPSAEEVPPPSPGLPASADSGAVEGGEGSVTCLWRSILPERDFQPEAGDAYRITVTGSDRTSLAFAYQRLKPYRGDVRIAVHTRKTPDNRILVDQANPALFTAETGEFTLSLIVPSGWPLYLVEEPANPYADPVVLSNIVELP